MKLIKYFIQFFIILILFLIFKILGIKLASNISSKIISLVGPIFRSKNLIKANILKGFPNLDQKKVLKISNKMWSNYGRILAEYVFIKQFRNSKLNNNIIIEGQEILERIKKK